MSADVTSTLTDLERRLVELEREISSVAGPAAAPVPLAASVPPPPPPVTPPPVVTPTQRVESMRAEVDELMRFREQLEATARELVAEYDKGVTKVTAPAVVEAAPCEGMCAAAGCQTQE